MTSPVSENPTPAQPQFSPLRTTLRRNALLIVAVFCVITSALLLASTLIPRTYAVRGAMNFRVKENDALPDLSRLAFTIANEQGLANAVTNDVAGGEGGQTLKLGATASRPDAALVEMHSRAEAFSTRLRHQAEDLAAEYRRSLQTRHDRLLEEHRTLTEKIDTFRTLHRGMFSDDPNSILAQFDKLSTRLDDKQQRLRQVTEQIARIEDYKRRSAQSGAAAAVPPPLPPPIADSQAATPAVKPETDPEVVALRSQLQLLDEQIQEQLGPKGRKEQHPYVVDLRTQQVNLQKRIDAALARAAAGQPAPPTPRPSLPTPAPADPTLAAAQRVELELAGLQAEQTTLAEEVLTLTAQRAGMQKQVDEIAPARREFQELTARHETASKERTALAAQLEDFDRRIGKEPRNLVDFSPVALAANSALPVFPRLSVIIPLSLGIGVIMSALLLAALHIMSRAIYTVDQAATLGVPILGAVSEIRSAGAARLHALWQRILRPALGIALMLAVAGSMLLCYRQLAGPGTSRDLAALDNPTIFASGDSK